MKKIALILLLGFCFNFSKANHITAAWLDYDYLGTDSIKVNLNIIRDCSGISISGFNPIIKLKTNCGLDSIYPTYVSSSILGLSCSALPANCNGGFGLDYEHLIYSTNTKLEVGCGEIGISFSNPYISIVNPFPSWPTNLNLYVDLKINPNSLNNGKDGLKIFNPRVVSRYGTFARNSFNPQINASIDDSLKVELIAWQQVDTTFLPSVVNGNGKQPFFIPS